jgi:tetratricopeptide (TPR) repeat protein
MTLTNIGLLQRDTHHPDDALQSLRSALAIEEGLAPADDGAPDRQAARAGIRVVLGKLYRDTGRRDEALLCFRQARDAREELASAYPLVTQYRRELAACLNHLGVMLSQAGQRDKALRLYQRALGIVEDLARSNSSTEQFRADMAWAHGNIGLTQAADGHAAEAARSFEKSLEILGELSRAHPDDSEYGVALARNHIDLGLVRRTAGDEDAASRSFEAARATLEPLARARPDDPDVHSLLGEALGHLGSSLHVLKRLPKALEALRRAVDRQRGALALAPNQARFLNLLVGHYRDLGRVHRALGQPSGAAKAALARRGLRPGDPFELYDVARELALCIPPPSRGEGGDYADRSMETLRWAISAGFRDGDRLGKDPAFAPLRRRDDFRTLMMDLAFPADPFQG